MSVTMQREWKCDNCEHTEIHHQSVTSPEGWTILRWNSRAPLGGMDADGWESGLMCASCWERIADLLDNPEPEEPAPTFCEDCDMFVSRCTCGTYPQAPDGGDA